MRDDTILSKSIFMPTRYQMTQYMYTLDYTDMYILDYTVLVILFTHILDWPLSFQFHSDRRKGKPLIKMI